VRLVRRYDKAPGAGAEQGAEHRLAPLEVAVARCARSTVRAPLANLNLVQVDRVANGNATIRLFRTRELQNEPRRQTIETPAHFAPRAEPRFDARARPKHLAQTLDDGRARGFLAQIAVRAGAELAHSVQEVFLPRQEDYGHIAHRDVAFDLAAQREAVESGHQHVAHYDVRPFLAGEVERARTVVSLERLAPRRANQIGQEPHDRGVIVGDQHATAFE
jgi:hypothetical protein